MSPLLNEIKSAWGQFDLAALDQLEPLYHSDVRFIEPAGEIHGRALLFKHFRDSCTDLVSCRFEFNNALETIGNGQACLVWDMHFKHKKLNRGSEIIVPGTTLLQFDERITFHRDWFDLGATVYEHVPVLGRIIKSVKSRLHEAVH